MSFVTPEAWRPVGIDDIERKAWTALRHPGHVCVVAGPGAGKTEFLAQKATYLLQTRSCPPPYSILAISFKRDAAGNLAERVRKRCPPEQARRFVSMTFDSFTKNLVDRFYEAIPEIWRPTRRYDVLLPKTQDISDFLTQAMAEAPSVAWRNEIGGLKAENFESHAIGGMRLDASSKNPRNGVEFAVARWWVENWGYRPRSRLSFVMINRLAELLLRENPQIVKAMRLTYRFVFLDEFQDTTYAQYDFLKTAFHGSRAKLTAVGDDKQRIMVWAGARVDAFSRFAEDFASNKVQLLFNYRSSPELVRIQHVVARALEPGTTPSKSQVASTIDTDAARIWNFPNEDAEAQHVAHWIRYDIQQRNLTPRDFVLLVRQKAEQFETRLQGAFKHAGLKIRNESKAIGKTTLQDLLSEELTQMTLSILRLGLPGRHPAAWRASVDALTLASGVDPGDEVAFHRVETTLTSFRRRLQAEFKVAPSKADSEKIVRHVFDLLDLKAVARSIPQYSVGDQLEITAEAIVLHLTACARDSRKWSDCLDLFDGTGQVPLMTVHKSKGLEYDTVLFLGLDDDAWWSHTPNNPEGRSTFFVALSRAKQRAIFTYCTRRSRQKVADLYQLLRDAGVQEIVPNTKKLVALFTAYQQ